MLLAAGFTTFGPMAVFFLGALAVLVRAELGFSEAQLGITVATFFAAATLSAALVGPMTERLGGRASLRLALTVATVALASLTLVRSWWQLTAMLAVAGLAHAVLQVGANLLLADQIPLARKGLAFGIKQSSIPMSTFIAGAAVPIVGAQFGWRWAYAGAAGLALLALATQWRTPRRRRGNTLEPPLSRPAMDTGYSRRQLWVLAFAAGFGAASVNALAAFLVEFAVSTGVELSVAGALLSTVSAIGIAARIGLGHWADVRGPVHLRAVAILLFTGGTAFAVLPFATTSAMVLWLGSLFAFVAGWGWPGLFTFVVARENAAAPATATGLTQAGIFAGAVAGPLLFGITVSALSYTVAWRAAAVSQVVAALLITSVQVTRARALAAPN